jgi:exodeoxyribonuclease V alpha subunit
MSADAFGPGLLPPAIVQMAQRIVRRCGERAGEDSESLAAACALALHQLSQGHTRVDMSDSGRVLLAPREFARGGDRIEVPVPVRIREAVIGAAARGSALVSRMSPADDMPAISPLVIEGERLSLARCRDDERALAQALRRRVAARPDAESRHALVERLMSELGEAALDDAQRHAVLCSVSRGLSVVTGGPGTGKTTVAAMIAAAHALVQESCGMRASFRLLAPTGKAASRLSDSFAAAASALPGPRGAALRGCRATTVHAALHGRDDEGLDHATMVILDEASMVDLSLMRRLADAVPAGATLVALGDRNQLASVEAGTVLADMTEPGSAIADSVTHLQRSHRFGGDSPIGVLARAVLEGDADRAIACLAAAAEAPGAGGGGATGAEPASGVRLIDCRSEREIIRATIGIFRARASDTAILCAHRHGATGTLEINRLCAEASGAQLSDPLSAVHWDGRPVIVTENDRALGLMNGDVGVMRAGADGRLEAVFAGRQGGVPAAILPATESAYALTIHKSQGSEFDHVAIVLPAMPSPILSRELVFTGITRARRSVTVIGPPDRVREAIGRRVARASGLSDRLRIG